LPITEAPPGISEIVENYQENSSAGFLEHLAHLAANTTTYSRSTVRVGDHITFWIARLPPLAEYAASL
jgi:hypothetical protein